MVPSPEKHSQQESIVTNNSSPSTRIVSDWKWFNLCNHNWVVRKFDSSITETQQQTSGDTDDHRISIDVFQTSERKKDREKTRERKTERQRHKRINSMFGSVSSVVGRKLATATKNQLHPYALLRRRFVALPRIPEGLSSLKSTIGIGSSSNGIRRVVPVLGAFAVATAIGQHYYGNEPNFYDYRFICDADPNDLADFYGSENFMVCPNKHQTYK